MQQKKNQEQTEEPRKGTYKLSMIRTQKSNQNEEREKFRSENYN